jgi:hypothetical protein
MWLHRVVCHGAAQVEGVANNPYSLSNVTAD